MKQNYNFWRQTRVRAKKISTAIVILLVFAATVQAQSVKDSAKEETKGNKVEIATPSAHIEGDHMKFDQSIKYPKAGLVYDFTTDIDMQNKTVSMAAKYNFWILEHTDIAKMAWNGQNISYTDETVWGNKAVAAIVFTGYVGDDYEYYDYFDVQLWTLNKMRKSYAAVSIKPLATRRMSLNIEQLLREGASADKIKDEVAKAVDGRVDNDGYWDQIYTTVHPLIGEPYCDNSFSFHRGNGVFSNNERNEIIKILNGLITEGNALKAAGYTLVGEFPGGDFNIEVEPGMPEPDWLDFLALIRDNYVPAAGYTGFWDSYYEDSCNDKGDGDYNDGKSVGEFGSEYIDPKKEKNWKNDEHYTPGITIIPDKARPSLGEKVDVSITVTINHGSSDVVKIENFNWGDGNGLGWFYIYVNNGVGVKTISHTYTKKGSYTISARGWWYPEGDQVSADASFDIYVKDPVNDDGRTILLDDPITNLKTVTLYGNCGLHSAEDAQAPFIAGTGGHRIACIHNTTLSKDKYDVRIPASAYPNEYAYFFGEFSDINNYTALKVKNDIFYETAGMDYTHCTDAGWVFEKNNWAGYADITTNPTIKAYTRHGGTADISRTLTGEGILSFYMKWDIKSSGRVTFYIDDEAKFSEESDHNWIYYRFILPPGNHTIKWHTKASENESEYYAIAELDNIKFVPGTPAEKEFLYDEVESLDGWNIHTYGGNSDCTPYLDNSWSTVGDYSCCFTSGWNWADYYGTIDKDVDLTYVRKIKVDLKGDDSKLKIYINGNTVGDIYANGAATYTYDVSNYSGICNLKFAGVPKGNQYKYMYLDNIVFEKQIFEPANPVPFDYSLVTCKNGTETTLASGTVNIPPEQVMGQDMYYFGIEKNGNNYTGYINNVEAGTGSTSNDFNNRIGIGAYSASNVSCVNFDGLKVYSPAPTNIAPLWNGGTITASGGFNSDYTDPATCVDENTETYIYYRTYFFNTKYITRDYGKPVYIEKVRLEARSSGTLTYFYLEVSNDGTNWIQKGECDEDDCNVLANSPWMSVNGNYRYVRIKKTGSNWWAMTEIEIIGIVPPNPNIAPLWNGGTITASGGFNSDYTDPATCVDENTETYIYYRTSYSKYITRDYGKPVYIEKVRLEARSSGSSPYFYLEVSNDGTNWIQKGECDEDDCNVLANSPWMSVNGNYRYVRIKKTGSNWWAMTEIEIIGIVDGVTEKLPVAQYHMDQSSGDVVPDAVGDNDGTRYGATWVSGKVGSHALSFDGSNDYVNVSKNLTGGLSEITLEAWVKGEQSANIIKTTSNCALLHFRGAGFYLTAEDGTTSGYLGYSTFPSLNEWHYIVATWNGSTMNLYVDGVSQGTRAFSGGSTGKLKGSSYLRIGSYFNDQQTWFKGKIDEVAIYDRALTAEEIAEHYNAGSCVAQYHMDQSSGDVVPDAVGDNDGTRYGATWVSGKVGSHALSFDGSNDYVNVSKNLTGGLSEITLEAWVKGEQSANIIKTTSNCALLHFRGAGFYLTAEDGTTSGYLGYSTFPSLNEWHYIVATWNGSTMNLYVDGVSQGTRAFSGGSTGKLKGSSYLRIGSYFNDNQTWFKGKIDEVAIYDRALTAEEIAEHYNAGSGGKGAEATGGEETVTDIPSAEEAGTLLVYPNPMSNELTIEYNIQQAGMVTVDIYNITGKLVQTVTSGYKLPGEHTVQWNANDTNGTEMPNGTYFIRVQSNSNIQTTKVVLMR